VENTRFLNGTYVLPRTAQEVIESELSEMVVMEAIPDLDKYGKGWKRCWTVLFTRPSLGGGLRQIEYVVCTICDIALLFECEQIIDVDMKRRYPTWTVIDNLANVKIPEELMQRSRMGQHLILRSTAKKDELVY
jgi:hypothetical protein